MPYPVHATVKSTTCNCNRYSPLYRHFRMQFRHEKSILESVSSLQHGIGETFQYSYYHHAVSSTFATITVLSVSIFLTILPAKNVKNLE